LRLSSDLCAFNDRFSAHAQWDHAFARGRSEPQKLSDEEQQRLREQLAKAMEAVQ
jgi:hypothetical protein